MLKRTAQSGQVGLVILLIMVVVSTIGLSVASRSTQEVTSSRQTQEAAETFAAAESAIERILSQGGASFQFEGDTSSHSYDDLAEDTKVDVSIAKQQTLETRLKEGVTAEVNVTGVATGNSLRIEWASSRTCSTNPASLIIELLNTNGAIQTTRYVTVAPCSHDDNFSLIDPNQATYQGSTYALRYDLPLSTNDTKVRLTPVYADTQLAVMTAGGWQLPDQQFTITSVGQSEAEGGRETQAVEVERTQPYAPGILDYALVSGTTIVK